MNDRFQIDDLMSQGPEGIVFRATDRETGAAVALRRYFPFGKGCGGLDEDARTAYAQSLEGLSSLKHPSLRQVLGGGCDEIDHIPYIVTEWVDGEAVEMLVSHAMLGLDDVTNLLKSALDTSLWLSEIFQKESLWVETELSTVIRINSKKSGDFNFWISPIKWLGVTGPDHDMKQLAGFATQLLHGVPMTMGNAQQSGIVRWIEWLRAAPKTATLTQAREKLTHHLQSTGGAPLRKLITPPKQEKPAAHKKPPHRPGAIFCLNFSLVMLVIGLGYYSHQVKQARADGRKPAAHHKANRQPAKKTAKKNEKSSRAEIVSGSNEVAPGELIAWDNHSRLLANNRRKITVEGPAGRIDQSKSGKTLYLVFFGGDKPESSRVGIRLGNGSPDQIKSELSAFVGKKIRASGEVKKEMQGNLSSPAVMVNDVSAIQIID